MSSLILGIIGSLVAAFLYSEIDGWGPWIARKLVDRSVKRISDEKRERYREEWSAHIDEMPTSLSKIIVALGFPLAARKIARIEDMASRKEFAQRSGIPHKTRMHLATYRVFDIAVATAFLIVSAPLLLLVGMALYLSDRGPVLFVHRRIGYRGQHFSVIKFRTMKLAGDTILRDHLTANETARKEWSETQKLANDPRVTWVGKVVRKLSLDELPQLFNVLRGNMSIVGPRPIVEAEVHRYGEHFEHYCNVKPGLTGPWQVSGRNDTTYRERVLLDAEYVGRKSVLLDLWLLLKTIAALFSRRDNF